MLSINFPFPICQGFWHRKKVLVPGEDAARLATSRKAESLKLCKMKPEASFQMTSSETWTTLSVMMPSSGFWVNCWTNQDTIHFHKLLFQTPGKLQQKALHPFPLRVSCPYQFKKQTPTTWLRYWGKFALLWKEGILQPGKQSQGAQQAENFNGGEKKRLK